MLVSYISTLQPDATWIPSYLSPLSTWKVNFSYTKKNLFKIWYFIPSHFDFFYDLKPKPPCNKKIITFYLHTSCNILEHDTHKNIYFCWSLTFQICNLMQLEFHLIHPHQAHQGSTCHIPKTIVNEICYFTPHFVFFSMI